MDYIADGAKKILEGAANIVPGAGIIRLISKAAAEPLKQTDQATSQGANFINQSNLQNREGQPMQYGVAPKGGTPPSNAMSEMTDVAFSGMGRMLGHKIPASPGVAGGFALQPSKVDSSQSSAPSSGMMNYLNYMKYRGGY